MATRASAKLVKASLTNNGRSIQSLSQLCSRAHSSLCATARQPGVLGVSSQNQQFAKTVRKKQVGPCLDQCRDQSTVASRCSLTKQLLAHSKVVHSLGAARAYCAVAPVQVEDEAISTDDDEGAFDRVGLSEHVKTKLHARGIHSLFPVQYKAYEQTKAGKDVIIQARTGTGKTLSFAIPLVEKLLQQQASGQRTTPNAPKVLVLTPTRELANQITGDFAGLSSSVKVVPVYGGTPITRQYGMLRRGCEVIVGTPGRVQDMIKRQYLSLGDVEHVVLDEVDTMLDIGFKQAVEDIIRTCYSSTRKPQTMLYSATITDWVIKTAGRYLGQDYTYLNFVKGSDTRTAINIQQYCCEVDERNVPLTIVNLASRFTGTDGRAIVFTEQKRKVDWYTGSPLLRNISRGLHGDKTQGEREHTLKGFKENRFQILICTSVAARGLDIPDVSLVIQTCPPNNTEDYIHRVGRTGRAGKNGVAVLFYDYSNSGELRNIEKACQVKLQHLDTAATTVTEETISKAVDGAYEKLDKAPEFLVEQYREAAGRYAEKHGGAESALAAALVSLARLEKLCCTSLLTHNQDAVTVQYSWGAGEKTTSQALQEVQTALGQTDAVIGSGKAVQDAKAVVFDVKPGVVSQLMSAMEEATGGEVEVLRELPKLVGHMSMGGGVASSYRDYGGDTRDSGRSSWGGGSGGYRSSRGGGGYDRDMGYSRGGGYGGDRGYGGGDRGYGGGDRGSYSSRYSRGGSFSSRQMAGVDDWGSSGGFESGGSQQRSGGSFNGGMSGGDKWDNNSYDDYGQEDNQQGGGQRGNDGYNRYGKSRGRFGRSQGEFSEKRKRFGERFGERSGEDRYGRDSSTGTRGFAKMPNFDKFEID